jgi:hypothetical protein
MALPQDVDDNVPADDEDEEPEEVHELRDRLITVRGMLDDLSLDVGGMRTGDTTAAGRSAVQVQHWLGHHSATFTLKTYIHLLDEDDLGGPLEPLGVNQVRTDPTAISDTELQALLSETAD